jgi:FG-GAP-like repeat
MRKYSFAFASISLISAIMACNTTGLTDRDAKHQTYTQGNFQVLSNFTIGAFSSPKTTDNDADNVALFRRVRDAGFNLVVRSYNGAVNTNPAPTPYQTLNRELKAAYENNLSYLIHDGNSVYPVRCEWIALGRSSSNGDPCNGGLDTGIAQANSIIDAFQNSPYSTAIAGYFIKDEPGKYQRQFVKDWIQQVRTRDPSRLAYINLLPTYAVDQPSVDGGGNPIPGQTMLEAYPPLPGTGAPNSRSAKLDTYNQYLDDFLNDALPGTSANPLRTPQVVTFDHYPLSSRTSPNPDYFYNLRIIRDKARERPFWAYVVATDYSNLTPVIDAAHMRFTAFAPIAYGAKGLVYYTFATEVFTDAKAKCKSEISPPGADNCVGLTKFQNLPNTVKYTAATRINSYINSNIGRVIMGSSPINVFHNGNFDNSGGITETLPTSEKITASSPLIKSVTGNVLVGAFSDNANNAYDTYYLFVMNRGYFDSQPTVNSQIQLRGKFYDKISVTAYPTSSAVLLGFQQVTNISYDVATDTTTLNVNGLLPGEGRLYRIVAGTAIQPAMADYDRDLKTDISVKTDDGRWLIDYAANGFGSWDWRSVQNPGTYTYGDASAHPVPADYDGDRKADLSVKTDDGRWLIDFAVNGFGSWDWQSPSGAYGNNAALPVPADYDGDGKTDLSVQVNANQRWLIDYAANGFGSWDWQSATGAYGNDTAIPVPADYDGDGKADLAFKVNGNGWWYIDRANNGFGSWDQTITSWTPSIQGSSFHPAVADFDGDRKADVSVKADNGTWRIDYAANGFGGWDWQSPVNAYGSDAAVPVPADYTGDGKADLSVKVNSDGRWLIDSAANGFGSWDQTFFSK